MTRKVAHLIFMIMVFLITGCIKDTYDMDKLSGKVHLSPSIVFSAINGGISFSDLVDSNDTIVFDQDNFVKIVFKEDSLFDFLISDFVSIGSITDLKENEKSFGQFVATTEPETINFDIEDILSRITGDIIIANPTIRLNYSNSFSYPIKMNLDVTGQRSGRTPVKLELDTFALSLTNAADQPAIFEYITIDNTNSQLSEVLSLPPEELTFSGSAIMDTLGIIGQKDSYLLSNGHIIGSIEIEVPLEFRINNLQFSDTLENFLTDTFEDDSDLTWDDFELFRIDLNVENGFPLGASLSMSLYDSINHKIISSIDANDILEPAEVDSNGKAAGVTTSTTSIDLTEKFFSSIEDAESIIFMFTLKTTNNGSEDVKIYSDYRIDFKAAMVLKPNINVNIK
jgi:hypothetical protein